jgi:murein DD-endopeptidase MepM/ murein hydrolase activator NlpD
MRQEVEVIVTSLYKPRTYQKRFTLWQIRLILIGAALFVILAALGIYLLHYTSQQNIALRYLYQRNFQLEAEANKLGELQNKLRSLEAERQKIAIMLGADKNPPPLDLAKLEESYTPYQEPQKSTAGSVFQVAPTTGYIISRGFSKTHTGLDFAAQLGMPVFAVATGVVEDVGTDTFYGNYIRLDIGGNYKVFYGHLYKTIKLKGEQVSAGDIIGYVGNSGRSSAPHLHLEILQISGGKPTALDPGKELKGIIKSGPPQ